LNRSTQSSLLIADTIFFGEQNAQHDKAVNYFFVIAVLSSMLIPVLFGSSAWWWFFSVFIIVAPIVGWMVNRRGNKPTHFGWDTYLFVFFILTSTIISVLLGTNAWWWFFGAFLIVAPIMAWMVIRKRNRADE